MTFGVYDTGVPRESGGGRPQWFTQVGFARVLTDRATFAYLADVFIVDAYRHERCARRSECYSHGRVPRVFHGDDGVF